MWITSVNQWDWARFTIYEARLWRVAVIAPAFGHPIKMKIHFSPRRRAAENFSALLSGQALCANYTRENSLYSFFLLCGLAPAYRRQDSARTLSKCIFNHIGS